ncbi:MAG: T9SS type A sorting domain-containing protein, partial [Saprospiraceae bacterium]
NTLTPTVNAAGSYSILVTNTDNGCTNTASTSVSQSPQVTAAVSGQSNVSCNGNTDGSATATAGGGFGAFTFHWSNGATTSSISGLATGNYLVTVTDTENCSATASVAITQPDPLVCNATATAQTQSGTNDGSATANPTGGTPGFIYAWSNGGTTQTITDLAPGAYTVVITDANGCTQSQTVTVNSVNCALVPSIVGTNISCFGAADGSATVSLLGANEPVTYTWSNGQTSATATNLTPGNYTVQILDAGGCPAEISVSIAQPVQLSASASATGESAQGANDGTASATAIGGTGTYTYLWSNGATTASIGGLAPGTYSVEVKDENGCASVQEVVVPAFTCALQTDLAVANVNCAGGTDGQATVLVNGGAAPYTYLWSNGQTTATATGLSVGNYSVQILDASGCETAGNVQVTEPTPLAVDLVGQTNVACPDDNTGEASIEANGGTGTFSYLWSNGQTSATATGLTAGNHTVQVTDANGCQQTRTVTILANDILPPVLVLQNATVPVGPNGLTGNLMDYIVTTMTDNCTVALVSFAPAQFDCSQLGQQSVEVTVMDAAGNAVSSTAQVLVVDETAPTVACPASMTKCYYENVVSYPAPSATDNCSGGQWALTSGLQSGATFPVGVTTQTYQYTDASGNAGNCSFDVIIVGPTEITAVETAGCFESCEGSLTVLGTAGGQQPVAFAWSNGQSGSTATGLCNNEITLTLTDNAGCRTQQTPVFDVPEPLDLQVVSVSNDVNNQQVGSANINVEGGEQPYSYVWTNAAGQIVSTSEDLTNVGAGSYNVQVTDANGCEIANSQTIVVQNTVGTAEPTWAKGMKLVPNPTPGLVQLRFVEQPAADMEITIVDATGRQLLTVVSVGERVVDLDLSHLPDGIYSVRLRMEGAVAVKKVVLSH